MVAHGEHVGAQVEEVLGDLRRQAKAAGSILGIHNREFDTMRLAHVPDVLAHDTRPALPKMSPTKRMFKRQLLASSS